MRVIALDIFCGAGGVSYGFSKAGIAVEVGVDSNEDCRFTYTQNNPGSKFLQGDIRGVSGRILLSHTSSLCQDDFLLLAACAPCQPFSSQNRYRDTAADKAVLRQVERLVRELRPDFLFIENVPGLQKVEGFSAFRRLVSALETLRYKSRFEVVDAASHGVPQHRKRLVLTASQYLNPPWAEPSHGATRGLVPYATVRDAISAYPRIGPGERHPIVPNHISAQIAAHNLNRLRATPRDGGSRSQWSPELVLKCHKVHHGHPDVYGRLCWDSPAPTLTSKCTGITNGRFGHPEQDRGISAREAAALQSFDDCYVFYGGIGAISRQIGNAVPPLLAEKFGAAFLVHAQEAARGKRKQPWQSLLRTSRMPLKKKLA